MNILILSWRGPGHPNAGGAELSTHEHAKGWVKAGHNVTLFTSHYHGVRRQEDIDGVHIIRNGSQVPGVQFEAFKWYLFGSHPRFDLVVDQFHGIPFFTPCYIRTKKLAFIHEVTKEVWKLNPWPRPFNLIPFFLGPLFEPLIFRLIYGSIPFMTVSESTKKDLIEWGVSQENITVVHNGVNSPKIEKFPAKEKKKTLIYLGALSRDKGIEDALRTFAFINDRQTGWQFWVVGNADPRYLKSLKLMAEKLKINRKIKFWGFVSEKKKFELLTQAHIAINPSVREGWGLVNIEANCVGLPVIAYDVAGSRDSVKNGKSGFLLPLGDYRGLAFKIVKVVTSDKLHRKLQEYALSWSKNFSWQKASHESLELIMKISG